MKEHKLQAIRRISQRGLTLVELMIVITIIGILAGAITFGIFSSSAKAQVKAAEIACTNFRSAVHKYRMSKPEAECPTPEKLKAEKEIDTTVSTKDPWGTSYKIVCDTDEIYAISFGPDKKEGTEDDIRVPAKGSK